MDLGTFLGVVLALFFGGLGIGYGGYSMQVSFPLLAFFSYMFGGGCIAASIVLSFLRVEKHHRDAKPEAIVTAPEALQVSPTRTVAMSIRWMYQTLSQGTDRISLFVLLSVKAGDRSVSIASWQLSVKWQSCSQGAMTEVFRNSSLEIGDADADIRWWQGTLYQRNLAWGRLILNPDQEVDGYLDCVVTGALKNKWGGRVETVTIEAKDVSGDIYKVHKVYDQEQ